MRLTFSATQDYSELHGSVPIGKREFGPQRRAIVYGDVHGSAVEGSSQMRDATVDAILDAAEDMHRLEATLRTALGSFFVVVQDTGSSPAKLELAASPGSAGFYFVIADNKLEVATDERSLFEDFARAENLMDDALANMLVCHQGLARTPYGSLFSNIHRCLPGGTISWWGGEDWKPRFFVVPENDDVTTRSLSEESAEAFGDVLERSLSITIETAGDGRDLALATSGGIDSSVLLAALCKLGKSFTPFHYPYSAGDQPDLKLASIVCDRLGVPLTIVEREELDIDHARAHGQAGFGTVIAPYKADFGFKDFQPSDKPTLEINGQNADTLYFVDTFTKSSRHTGWLRFRRDLRTMPNRILLSHSYLNGRPAPAWLQMPPFKVNDSARNGGFVDFIKGTICSTREHTPGFYDPSPEADADPVAAMVIEHRRERILEPYLKAFGIDVNDRGAWPETGDKAMRLLRMAKWFRFVQNVHANYSNFQTHHQRIKHLPYSQGRLSQILLEQRLDLPDMFFVKRMLRKYFRQAAGFTYSAVIDEMRDGRSKPIPDPEKRKRQVRAEERRPKFEQTAPNIIAERLATIIDAKRMYLCDLVRNPALRDRLQLDYKRLLGEAPIEDRAQLMEVTRLVNLELWLKSALSEE
ncbi:hypothetical protein [Roseibium sp.]|uniref:hypothetical protein n=1 Tax=Roseibium sp. TaxID=1936156 RepID=UPI003B51532C